MTTVSEPILGGLGRPGLLDRERIVAGPGFNRWLVPPCALAIHLCIGMAYGFSVFWLPLSRSLGITQPVACDGMSLLGALFTSTCDWRVADSGEVRRMIEGFDTDLGVTYLDGDDPDGLPLYRERYQCITAADGPLADRTHVTWAEVLRQPLCLLSPDMQNRRIIEEMAAALGAPVEPVVESNSMLLLFAYLRAARGASIMPLNLPDALSSAEDIRAIPIVEPHVSHTVGLVASGRAPHTPLVASFLADARRFRDAADPTPPPPRLSATPLAVVAGGARRR